MLRSVREKSKTHLNPGSGTVVAVEIVRWSARIEIESIVFVKDDRRFRVDLTVDEKRA